MHRAHSIGYPRTWIVRIAFAFALLFGAISALAAPAGRIAAATDPSATPLAPTPPAQPAPPPPPTAPAPAAITTGAPPRTFIRRLGAPAPPKPHIGQPLRLKIPAINVDAAVEQVGQTPDGAMDVPKDFNDTAWYDLGARPGEQGNAVVAGHVDSTTGKAVFWDLRKLASGDQIIVVGDDNVERQFVVTGSEAYGRADVPLDRIFGPTTETHLNLITCDSSSAFDRTKREYAGNLVVYAKVAP
jgi:sortase family protein